MKKKSVVLLLCLALLCPFRVSADEIDDADLFIEPPSVEVYYGETEDTNVVDEEKGDIEEDTDVVEEEKDVVEEEGKLLPVVDIVEVEDMDSATMHETEASVLADLSEAEAVEVIGPMATQDMKRSGILASVTTAQFILESGYGHSELAQGANNLFGMKASLSNNTWTSAWDGVSTYTKQTGEQNPDGSYVTITADFRAYPCIEKSIEDHSDYLLGAMKGDQLRYAGLKGEKDYRKAVQLIKDGGYATSLTYVEKLCNIIERWDLTRFDV